VLPEGDRSVAAWDGRKEGGTEGGREGGNKVELVQPVGRYVNGHAHNYQRIAPFSADLKTKAKCAHSAVPSVYAACDSYVNVVVGSPGNR
jgi:hypothetical protein